MDPNANIREQLTAAHYDDRARLLELRRAYAAWRAGGGFAASVRVEIAPHLDAWMAGDRFGTIEYLTPGVVHVHMDRSGKHRRIALSNVTVLS